MKYMTKTTTLSPTKITEIAGHIKAGNYPEVACKLAGVNKSTYYHWRKLGETPGNGIYSEFYEAIEEANAEREALLVRRLVESKNVSANKWMLERMAPERWGKATYTKHEPEKAEEMESSDSLKPLDRFKLCARALEQNDEAEYERLFASCPRYTYRMFDREFKSMLEAARRVITMFQLRWSTLLTQVQMIELAFANMDNALDYAKECYYEAYYNGYEAAGGVITYSDSDEGDDEMSSPYDPPQFEMPEVYTELQNAIVQGYLEQVTELKAMWTALERLCTVCHISTQDLLAWSPYLQQKVAAAQVYLTSPNPCTILLLPAVKTDSASVDKELLSVIEKEASKYYSEDEWQSKLEQSADSYVATLYALWKGDEIASESS